MITCPSKAVQSSEIVLSLQFFIVNTKLAEMAVMASNGLTTAKKFTSSGARPDARDYYWIRSPMSYQLSQAAMCM